MAVFASASFIRLLLAAFLLIQARSLGVGQNGPKAPVIPDWKLELKTGNATDWWTRYDVRVITGHISRAIWGKGLPAVTGSPAQDVQYCPVIKLPAMFSLSATHRSWTGQHGEWNTVNGVPIATWEQDYFSIGFTGKVDQVGVYIRDTSTGQVAASTRLYSDKKMYRLFQWKLSNKAAAVHLETDFNIGIFDCSGSLMYVVKSTRVNPKKLHLYSRQGLLIAQSSIGKPVIRYEFSQPSTGYLIATAEAPGVNASVKEKDIPYIVEAGGVLPFGIQFQDGGYTNSSALMDPGYRWVIAAAVQALAVYKSQPSARESWTTIAVVRALWVLCIGGTAVAMLVALYWIYRTVYPWRSSNYNPFLVDSKAALLEVERARATIRVGNQIPNYGASY